MPELQGEDNEEPEREPKTMVDPDEHVPLSPLLPKSSEASADIEEPASPEPPPPGEETEGFILPEPPLLVEEPDTARIEVIDVEDIMDESTQKQTAKKKKSRRSYSFQEKATYLSMYFDIIHDDDNASYRVVAEQVGVHYSLLKKWLKMKDEIIAKATDETLASLKKRRPTTKHIAVYPILYKKFKVARKAGKKINFKWLWVKGAQIAAEQKGPTFTSCATQDFLRKYQIRIRRTQNTKRIDKEAQEPRIRKWHLNYREGFIKSGRNKAHYDAKWGRFAPSRRFNMDQGGNCNSIDILDLKMIFWGQFFGIG